MHVCPKCGRYYDSATGEIIPKYEHIRIEFTNNKDLCKPCTLERQLWDPAN